MTLARPGTCSCNFGHHSRGCCQRPFDLALWGPRWMVVDGPVLTLVSTALLACLEAVGRCPRIVSCFGHVMAIYT